MLARLNQIRRMVPVDGPVLRGRRYPVSMSLRLVVVALLGLGLLLPLSGLVRAAAPTPATSVHSQTNFISSPRLGRFNAPLMAPGQDGAGDPAFKSGAGFNESVLAEVVQSDGKILIGGAFTSYNGTAVNQIIRLKADSTLDTTFNPAGSGPNEAVDAIVVQSDGKILIGGYFTTYNGTASGHVARLNTDGSLDTAFNPAGANSDVLALAVQSDGKILIGGDFTTYNGTATDFTARLNSDGSLDTAFNSSGDGANDYVVALAVQSDGKILIGGAFNTYNGTTAPYLARLNTDGTLDTAFNLGGTGINDTGTNSGVSTVAVQSDGKILIGGDFTIYNGTTVNHLARLNTDGTLDTAFNSGGTGPDNEVLTIAVQSDGKILIGGAFNSYNGTVINKVARLKTDGTLDTAFNTGGTGANGDVYAIAFQSDGKVIVGGAFNSYNGVGANRLTRLNPNGTLDTAFNPGNSGADGTIQAVAVQSSGKIIVGGNFTSYNGITAKYIARLNTDGTLDTTFNPAGSGANRTIRAITLQGDGKIIVGGDFTSYNGTTTNYLARLNTDGTLDTTFNPAGSGADEYVQAIAVQGDGKIVIGGNLISYNGATTPYLARLNPDGTLDTTFNPAGSGADSNIRAIAFQSNGQILIGGDFTSYDDAIVNYIARLNPDGSLDTTFNPASSGAETNIRAIAVQSDSKIVIGGDFTSYDATTVNHITRLNTDGTLDTTFNPAGSGANDYVNVVTLQSSDGKILVGGNFTSYDGTTANYIARLKTDGTLDTTFNPGSGANDYVFAITLQKSDSNIIIGGDFTSVDAYTRDHVARLLVCDPLKVTSNADDGSCGTLRVAVTAAPGGSTKTVTINLAAGSVINLTSGLTVSGVNITTTAGCGNTPIILAGSGANSGNGLTLSGTNTLTNLWVRGFSGQQIVASNGSHTIMQCIKATKS